jgi:hypothetical protein
MLTITHTHQPSRWNWRLAAALALNVVLWVALVGLVVGGAQMLEVWL